MSIFALADCNNFYASCERAFNPSLNGKPIVILSNNDGCIVARSNESKQLGIPMGAPYFQWKTFCQKKHVAVYSSNYALYGDMSQRVMTILEQFCPEIEIYSIDEAFLLLNQFACYDLTSYLTMLRNKILRWTGIPVSIGFAPTKTLAKIANFIAKKHTTNGVYNLLDTTKQNNILQSFPVQEIWGIGKKLAARLQTCGYQTAQALRDADTAFIRKHFGVVMARIQSELRGIPCLSLESIRPRQQIMSSRSFGRAITQIEELSEAISHYTALACQKLRKQNSHAARLYIFLQTRFENNPENHYENGMTLSFPTPLSASPQIIAFAQQGLRKIFKPGYQYKKAGVILLDLSPTRYQQNDLFSSRINHKHILLSETADRINQKLGKEAVLFCAEGIQRSWKNRNNMKSPSYTTKWSNLAQAYCR